MRMLVIGCGRVGAELASRLNRRGHSVVVLDCDREAFHNLEVDFRGRTVEGEALSHDALLRAGIDEVDGLAAVTSSDTINAVVAHLAKFEYNVPTVVVRNFDSRLRSLHEVFGLPVVSSSSWGAQRIEELLYEQETTTVFSAGNGEVELYEFNAPGAWVGRSCSDLMPNENCLLVAVTRAGRAMLPNCDLRLEEGDQLLVSATLEGSVALQKQLNHAHKAERSE